MIELKRMYIYCITDWAERLSLHKIKNGKSRMVPTANGIAMGITTEIRMGRNGEYSCVVYNENAQVFVIENLNEIMDPKSV